MDEPIRPDNTATAKPEGPIPPGNENAPASASPPPAPRERRHFGHLLKSLVLRVHALAVLLLVGWAGFLAVSYLLNSVFLQTPIPRRILDWQGRSDAASLRSTNAPGLSTPADRAPLGHFHCVDPWFQPDPHNGCTVSGCHAPLPHTQKLKVPAFANFHATFLSCQMCHAPADGTSQSVAWITISDSSRQDPPAILRLIRYLEINTDTIQNRPAEAHRTIVPLLRTAAAVGGNDATLSNLFLQVDTSEPGSPVWRMAVAELTRELPSHARGDYAAKLVREQTPGAYRQTSASLRNLARRYLANSADPTQRRELHQAIHGPLLKEPVTCLSCHGDKPAAIDFEALDYSPKRAKTLSQLQLARLMQQIRQGQQFFLPKLLETGDAK
ncbi:MAG: hypothetical protein ACM359_19440 [Bacillota bacterium]